MIKKEIQIGRITFILGDCNETFADFCHNQFELAIVDPPYGINADKGVTEETKKQFKDLKLVWDSVPNDDYFKELKRVSKNQIIWGANHFIDKVSGSKNAPCWIIWDKKNPDRCFADCEMAWTSFKKPARIFDLKRVQELHRNDFGRIHPTQKPTALYLWLLNKYSNKNDYVLDTHGGSMSMAIASHIFGNRLYIVEKNEDFFNAAIERFKNATKQKSMFEYEQIQALID